MSNEIMTTSGNAITESAIWTGAVVETVRGNYKITAPNTHRECVLKRDEDFQKLPKMKKPVMLKPAFYKIMQAYNVFALTDIRPIIERADENNPLFSYAATTELFVIAPDGTKIVVANGHGAASTGERRNGFASAHDTMNTAIKFAEKRSLSDAVINLTGLSNIFYQDAENDDFVTSNYEEIKATADDNAPITAKQIKRLYAIGNQAGHNVQEIKDILGAKGYTSTKDIKQKDYDEVCKLVGESK